MGMLLKRADFRDQYFNAMIPKMYDSGIMDHIFSKWKSPKDMKEPIVFSEEALTFEHLILPLIFLSVGISLSSTLFAAEFAKKCSGGRNIANTMLT